MQFQGWTASFGSVIPRQAAAGVERDRGLERLRTLTVASVLGAAGLAAALSVMAASTIPGHTNPGSASPNTASTNAQAQGQDQSLAPFGGFVGVGGGTPHAVSGGS